MKTLLTLLTLFFPAIAAAGDTGGMEVLRPVVFETPAGARTGAGYMEISNLGAAPDRLVAVEADFPRVMIHESAVVDGVAVMTHLDGVDIPAGATVVFAPGGKHIMFMGLSGDPLAQGDTVPATLVFETAGRVEIVFDVVARDAAGGHSHGKTGG